MIYNNILINTFTDLVDTLDLFVVDVDKYQSQWVYTNLDVPYIIYYSKGLGDINYHTLIEKEEGVSLKDSNYIIIDNISFLIFEDFLTKFIQYQRKLKLNEIL